MAEPMHTVAICNSSDDTIEVLSAVLTLRGYRCVSAHVTDIKRGTLDFAAFLAREDPRVIVWDIALPYDRNWEFFEGLRASDAFEGRGIVLTTTHKANLEKAIGRDSGAIEILLKPYDIAVICDAVQQAVSSPGGRRDPAQPRLASPDAS